MSSAQNPSIYTMAIMKVYIGLTVTHKKPGSRITYHNCRFGTSGAAHQIGGPTKTAGLWLCVAFQNEVKTPSQPSIQTHWAFQNSWIPFNPEPAPGSLLQWIGKNKSEFRINHYKTHTHTHKQTKKKRSSTPPKKKCPRTQEVSQALAAQTLPQSSDSRALAPSKPSLSASAAERRSGDAMATTATSATWAERGGTTWGSSQAKGKPKNSTANAPFFWNSGTRF